MRSIFSKTSKNKKSDDRKFQFYSWGIPAGFSEGGTRTCPNMQACAVGCYAKMGNYVNPVVKNKQQSNFDLTLEDRFVPVMMTELGRLVLKAIRAKKRVAIRIHDAGDFYSQDYLDAWAYIIRLYPEVEFYAYTKMVGMLQRFAQPDNFTVIYSLGGTEDVLIDMKRDRHSAVFEFVSDLKKAGYADASNDDKIAVWGKSKKIGLTWHGNHVNKRWNSDKSRRSVSRETVL